MNEDKLKYYTRKLTASLTRTQNPPVGVEAHEGRGVQVILHHADGFLHVCLTPSAQVDQAYLVSGHTAMRYIGKRTLSPGEREWLGELGAALATFASQAEWIEYLDWAAGQPAVALPGSEFEADHGNAELVRINTRCNARCDFCSARGVLSDLIREPGRVAGRLQEMKDAGIGTVSFTGGEPTLLPELPELLRTASQMGFTQVDLQSNGLLLARRELVERLADAGLTSVFLSLHSADATVHDAMLGVQGAFDKALECVDNCLQAGITVRYNCVLTTRNLSGPAELIEFINDRFSIGDFHFCLSFIALQGWALDHPELVPRLSRAAPVMTAAIETADRLGVDLRIPGLCGVPICLIPGHPDKFDEYHSALPPAIAGRSHVEACEACPHRPRCSGFWTAYLERFGGSELGYREP